ncbi:MAG: transcriptional regulator, TetR family protein [Herbinix sp.]|jgi:AcrR family transcriptional regulator|nr:transcriptional regulator, TetR family protein [Herbinix sp.]
MNEGFFSLSEERKNAIISAVFMIFAMNSYKKAPVGEIAKQAGISKSLLLYQFSNKKDLYIFLWNKAMELTKEQSEKYKVLEIEDLKCSVAHCMENVIW